MHPEKRPRSSLDGSTPQPSRPTGRVANVSLVTAGALSQVTSRPPGCTLVWGGVLRCTSRATTVRIHVLTVVPSRSASARTAPARAGEKRTGICDDRGELLDRRRGGSLGSASGGTASIPVTWWASIPFSFRGWVCAVDGLLPLLRSRKFPSLSCGTVYHNGTDDLHAG
jgi:hypothetical protein